MDGARCSGHGCLRCVRGSRTRRHTHAYCYGNTGTYRHGITDSDASSNTDRNRRPDTDCYSNGYTQPDSFSCTFADQATMVEPDSGPVDSADANWRALTVSNTKASAEPHTP